MDRAHRAYPWVLVALLWVVWMLNYVDRQLIFSVFPLLQVNFNLSPVQLGLISSVFLYVYAFASPLSGYLADRFGCRRMIIFSLLLWSLATWATAYAHTFTELLLARSMMGMCEAAYLPAGLALITIWHSEKTRSKAIGIHFSGLYIGMIFGGVLGGWLGSLYGWRRPFALLGTVGVIYSVFVALFLRAPERTIKVQTEQVDFWRSVRTLSRSTAYLRMLVVFSLISICNWIVYTWLPLYIYERFHSTLSFAGFSSTFYLQVGSILGILIGGSLADRWSMANRRGRLITQVLGLTICVPALFLSGGAGSMVLLACGMLSYGIGRGAYDANAMPVLCQVIPPNLRATGYGCFNFVSNIAGGLASIVVGVFKNSLGVGGFMQIASIALAMSILLLLSIRSTTLFSEHELASASR